MIGCKVMRTLASVEIEIMLILGLTCCLSSSSVRCLENADGAQSSRVPIPFSEDPYEAIRQAYLDGTNTESEPFEDLVETETLESPLTVAPPTSLPESTLPTLVLILRRTARMVVRVPLEMSPGLSASMAEVAAMFESVFRKRFRPSYESLPSSSPPCHIAEVEGLYTYLHEAYRGTSSVQGPLPVADEDPAAGDRGLLRGSRAWYGGWRAHGMDDRVMVLDDESVGSGSAPESKRRERVSASRQPTLATWTDPEDGMVYIDVPTYPPPPPIQTPPSPEWMSWFISISPSPISSLASGLRTEGFRLRWELAEERHARLEWAKVVDSMRRGQEPRRGILTYLSEVRFKNTRRSRNDLEKDEKRTTDAGLRFGHAFLE
ncbi:hypothetical protein Tco_0884230 [Tanacetum coccineum]